ncbi:MAG: GntR family transcriptional regulator [Actinobacteria bacterium]|nr:GntR family transcriptional regulator [Actinomycetota bacterium]
MSNKYYVDGDKTMTPPNRAAARASDNSDAGRPPSMQEWVVTSVRRLLLQGELRPGQRVNQGDLAARLGVSPVPVREALQVLSSSGLLKSEPGRGFWVPEPNSSDVAEIDLLARLLEHEALMRGIPVITDDEIALMQDLYAELVSLENSDDMVRKAQVHRELHFVPFRSAGLHILEADLARYWDHIDHHRVLYMFKDGDRAREALHQHESVIAACQTGDPEEVIRVMDIHRNFAMKHMLEQVSDTHISQIKEM